MSKKQKNNNKSKNKPLSAKKRKRLINIINNKLQKKKTYNGPVHLANHRRKVQLNSPTPAELHIKSLLKETDYHFDNQHIMFFGRSQFYILDFYIAKEKLCIEVDGYHHISDTEQSQHDELRDLRLYNKGILTIRILNKEALNMTKQDLVDLIKSNIS